MPVPPRSSMRIGLRPRVNDCQAHIAVGGPDVVYIGYYDLRAVVGRWISVVTSSKWRNPVCGTIEDGSIGAVADRAPHRGHADRVLLRLRGLVDFDVIYYVVLPLRRVRVGLRCCLIQYIVKIAHGVDDLANVGLLRCQCCSGLARRLDCKSASGVRRVAVDAVNVVRRIEGWYFQGFVGLPFVSNSIH